MHNEITKELSEAFSTDLADAVTSFVGERVVKGDYNPITGESNDTTVSYSGRGVFGAYSSLLVDGESILSTDKKLTALQDEVTDMPCINDKINDFVVISVSKDPANVSWIVQLRV